MCCFFRVFVIAFVELVKLGRRLVYRGRTAPASRFVSFLEDLGAACTCRVAPVQEQPRN